MKKTEVLLVLSILLSIGIAYSQQAGTGVGLTIIDTAGPIIVLIEPLNNSGDTDGNITLSYNISDSSGIHNCSLIINNKINATNTSVIAKDTRLSFTLNNTAIGSYNWSINCTDSLGYNSSSEDRTFSVNFLKSYNGTTTNLSKVANISNVFPFIIDRTPYGKITFTEPVDLSRGLDIDRYVDISRNSIELNSTALFELNKTADLELLGLSFTNPRPLRDNEVCPITICTEMDFITATGNFTFNVTHFTVYSSEETPVAVTPPPGGDTGAGTGGGGGGGGGGNVPIGARQFTLSTEILKVILKQGQTKQERFTIKNTGELAMAMTIDLREIVDFIISPPLAIDVILQPGEEEEIFISFKADANLTPDVYPRMIYIKGPEERIIYAVIEVESASPLFDVDVEVLPEYKSIFPGDSIFTEVSLFNIRGFGRVDVNLEYSIRDFKGKIITSEQETVAIETQAKFSRELLVPSDIAPGTYVASVKVTFEDSVGLSSDLFEVKAKTIRLYPIVIKDNIFYILLGVVVIVGVGVFFVYNSYLSKKRQVPIKKSGAKLIRAEGKIQKLKKELTALESAYKSQLISEASYKNNKERVEKELKKLRE